MVVTPNPLEAFIDWLIDELPQEFDTIAFSHFGGRFDMVLVFKELFLRGKLNLLRKCKTFRIYSRDAKKGE